MNMSNKNGDLDRRVKRTRQVIRDALISLIAEKGFDAISVKEITDRADINRSTFYFHYVDKYDLLEQSIDEMLKAFTEALKLRPVTGNEPCPVSRNASFVQQFEHIAEHAHFYKVMLGEKGIPGFAKQMKRVIEEAFYQKLDYLSPNELTLDMPRDILCRYVTSAHFGVIEHWLENDLAYSPAYMSNLSRELVKIGPLNAEGILAS
jgi:AcrR family transcriptional regulator